jgi:hypothetical protein
MLPFRPKVHDGTTHSAYGINKKRQGHSPATVEMRSCTRCASSMGRIPRNNPVRRRRSKPWNLSPSSMKTDQP